MTRKQKAWCKKFEEETGFDVLWTEELESGERSWEQFVSSNLQWLRDHTNENINRLQDAAE